MHTPTTIRTAPSFVARRMIGENMATAIRSGCGAVVEVTLGRAGHYIVSGTAQAVRASAEVMSAAGLTLVSIEDDAELGETFADWCSA